jgi:phosphate transport system protein
MSTPGKLERQIDKLKNMLLAMSAEVEASVRHAVTALEKMDAELAQKVMDGDERIDLMEVDLEEECLKVLALYQPVAIDLRFIVAVLKINNDLERIGDMAANIARRTLELCDQGGVEAPFNAGLMAEKVQAMLKKSLDALVNLDADLARSVLAADDEVDKINYAIHDRVIDSIRRNPAQLENYIRVLLAGRHLERIADHAANIAEDVIYLVEGEIVRHRA